jgi:hypothetical protein
MSNTTESPRILRFLRAEEKKRRTAGTHGDEDKRNDPTDREPL